MMFRRMMDALTFHSAVRLTSERDAAALERKKEDAKWHWYDPPAVSRKRVTVARMKLNNARAGR